MSYIKDEDLQKRRLRHPSLPFDSLPYPTRTYVRSVNHVTTKRKEVDHILWGWGSVPRVLRARGSSAIKTHKMYLKSSFTRFSSADPSRKENLSKANLSLDLLTFFFDDNWVISLTSSFHLYISSVHFTDRRGAIYWIWLNSTALAQVLVEHPRANGCG